MNLEDIYVFRKTFEDIHSSDKSIEDKITNYRGLFVALSEQLTEESQISFTTFFSRISFLSSQAEFDGKFVFLLHQLRRISEGKTKNKVQPESIVNLYEYCIASLISHSLDGIMPNTSEFEEMAIYQVSKRKKVKYRSVVNVIILDVILDKNQVVFIDEKEGEERKIAQFDIAHQNELFNKNIENISKYFKLPLAANFIDADITVEGIYEPKAIVLNPDFLIDVTSIASIFTDKGSSSLLYLLSKFKPRESSMPLLIGNVANHMLDDLITNPKLKFKDFIKTLFGREAIPLALYSDKQARELIAKLESHFNNLSNTINENFNSVGLNPEEVYLEPSFYSRDYGLQGRLDLLKYDDDESHINIVELKSGKPFRPNVYGINQSHYTQTLLYELLIKSSFEGKRKANSFILYSSLSKDALKHAPVVKPEQYEAIKTRNDLIIIEQMMTNREGLEQLLGMLKTQYLPNISGFTKKDLEEFERIYCNLSPLHKAYFLNYATFIAREFQISKTGEHGIMNQPGHAGLWLLSNEEKEERYIILKELKILENNTYDEDPIIKLKRTEHTNELANFRVGDIIVLYPHKDAHNTKENNQIFKGIISELSDEIIEVRLRSKQSNQKIFQQNEYWNIEEDSLDGSFNTMYRSLFDFLKAPNDKKDLVLGLKSPSIPIQFNDFQSKKDLTEEQNSLLKKIIESNEYYLLWGPPGTGKTSKMVKHIVDHYHQQELNILVIAYTNRAVDEMCEAIKSIDSDAYDKSIRIGSKYSTSPEFQSLLLNQKIAKTKNRKELTSVIKNANITIATLSSILGKHELFEMKKFDIAIVDEASQILEPMLVGLLTRVKKFILIGDHKQLPAVVIQNHENTKITDDCLLDIGFESTSSSFFERMYKQLSAAGKTDNIGCLSHQGRMHKEIMDFANRHFYENKLQTISFIDRLSTSMNNQSVNPLLTNRTIFIDTPIEEGLNWKTNIFEAKEVAKILKEIIEDYEKNGRDIHNQSIGVITLYRAQIACIKNELQDIPLLIREKISIDTVERYQGSARDIVIISLCTNRLSQLKSIVSLSEDGTDRKLNVAITRAKEQLIVIGNKNILSQNAVYQDLIKTFHKPKI